jgi:chemotaxis protein MotB
MYRTNALLTLLAALTLLPGCVSKKVFTETEATFQAQLTELRTELGERDQQIRAMEIELARAAGGNDMLLATQDKLQARIDDLQEQIVAANRRAAGNQESLQTEIRQLEDQRAALEARLATAAQTLRAGEAAAATLAEQLREQLDSLDRGGLHRVEQEGARVVVDLNEALLFRGTATNRLEPEGQAAIEAIGRALTANPVLVVQVTGHTDNQRVPRQSLDNWQYAAARAATVIEFLTTESGLSANRLTLASHGEFRPRQSNQTAEGRAQNRRVELIIEPAERSVLRELRRSLEQ